MNKVNYRNYLFLFIFIWFCQGLEERLRAQNNSNASKPITTRATTATVKSSRHTFKDEKVESHTDKNGICYRIGGKKNIKINLDFYVVLFLFRSCLFRNK